ncbi:MAG TPA: TIGR00645 family protein [Guyparkeria sp.]|nr:TIGR00645 family protein [Guyparkeria sp.]
MEPENPTPSPRRSSNAEHYFEHFLFASRWLIAPVYLGLIGAMLILLVKFGKELWHLISHAFTLGESEIFIGVLTLVDVALIMNLLIIIIFSGYENFVSKMDDLRGHHDRPEWMGHISFTDLKIKVIGSIVAISGIELLKSFMNIENLDNRNLGWMVGIHLTFVLSGVLYAVMDWLQGKSKGH